MDAQFGVKLADNVLLINYRSIAREVVEFPFADVATFYGFKEFNPPEEIMPPEPSLASLPEQPQNEAISAECFWSIVIFEWSEGQMKYMLHEYYLNALCGLWAH